jgi:hypothetical protein
MNAIPVVALRSALFALLFYFFTTLCVLACVLAAFVSAPLMRRIVTLWGQIHRSLCRYVLGQRIRIVGDLPREPQLYVFKHEVDIRDDRHPLPVCRAGGNRKAGADRHSRLGLGRASARRYRPEAG